MAELYKKQSDYTKAEPLLIRALAIEEAALGPGHPSTGATLDSLAGLYESKGNYSKAEPSYLRALTIRETVLGPDHPDTGITLNNLAFLYYRQGDYAKAEPLYMRALTIKEAALGSNHHSTGASLNNLAELYRARGDYVKAEPLLLRALAISEAVHGLDHPYTGTSLNNLAVIYLSQGKYAKAESLMLRALTISETAHGSDHPGTGRSLNNLAALYDDQGDYIRAEAFYLRAIAIDEAALGRDHPSTAISLNNLAVLYERKGDYSKAEPILFRALRIRQDTLGEEHPDTASSYGNLAYLYIDIMDWLKAGKYIKSAVDVFERRALRGSGRNSLAQAGADKELKDNQQYFYNHAYVSSVWAVEEPEQSSDLFAQAYSSSQYALRTSAGAALGQAAARFAVSDDALSEAVRLRQDLTGEWTAVNESLTSSIGSVAEERNKELEQSYRERLVVIDDEIADIDTRLEAEFPEYFALTSPKPLGVEETQGLLYDNEALVMFLAGDKGTLVFVLTKDKADWTLVDVDASDLETAVRVLRASLENPQQAFPRGQAHGIYKALMSGVEELVSDKDHVFLVPSGALGSIPLGVLVVDPPEGDDSSPEALRATKWWGTQQALTTLPSISSLKALRLLAKDGRGTEPFAGFGNPVLTGPDGTDRSVQYASRGAGAYFKGKYADVEAVRSLSPLPKTKTELLSLANAMRSEPKQSLWLGDRATETNLKEADLSEKRVLAFATHGLMSGEMSGLAEPALVLTPPAEATDVDDGLLTASEAALLNLNADWVILSACNTAAADEPGADGLSGLARSFFYAGARSMLVSHWPVRDDAAARLTTAAISMQDDNPDLGRAEALRRSCLLYTSPSPRDRG